MDSAKRLKRDSDNEEDRIISNLPDDILVKIFSLLTMREGTRLSILSRRWKSLGSYSSTFFFDTFEVLHETCEGNPLLATEMPKLVSWVNQVVRSHRGPTINWLRLQYYLTNREAVHINAWVNFAIGKSVKVLDLDFDSSSYRKCIDDYYKFPTICHTIQGLGCKSLRCLRLVAVNADEAVVQSILSNCSSLENLFFVQSLLPPHLKVVGESLKLKHLEIYFCLTVESMEISAKNLASLKYCGPQIRFSLKNVPRLVEICIGGFCCGSICDIVSCLPLLESLTLEDNFSQNPLQMSRFLHLPNLQHLKILNLNIVLEEEVNLLGLVYLIQACPVLTNFKLELTTWISEGSESEKLAPVIIPHWARRSNKHLKVIQFTGFVRNVAIDVDFAIYLVESSCALALAVFDTRPPEYIGSNFIERESDEEYSEQREAARTFARQLRRKLNKGARLIVM